ncbi:binding-protein-dependent transport systems inner membrane component [Cellulomonas flavigena DSM 20109]|uniref:Binding-protein-dependent transport systems inner membrane component n=1 Tax=Cellulomonas flavigena (strain ATCC 482 / DSM 20109 / BCRC 11376 / JCM 18109 / NBRC 3775 / NCIMB 8073 / NRS 134) TaxID=446466 RepID=D5UCZ7_CELFN|nr:ABC transporter permease subunit [Cellulomonas flavigena]ADG74334.1 binding-protein-dependent transport systems inner membrane component [Cellulomonas flavigena DSM 20109]
MSGGAVARRRGTVRQVLPPVVLLVALVTTWHAVVTLGDVPAFVLPGPAAILDELTTYLGPVTSAALVTGGNALVGLVVGATLGVLLAVVAAVVRLVDVLAEPVVAALAVVPVVALAPVLYAMYGAASEQARVLVAALAVFVPVYVTTLRGLRQVRPVHRDLMHALAATPRQAALAVTVPTAVPFVFTGLRMASSLAVISAIVAEYFGGPRSGIGSFITTAASASNYARAWAYVLGGVVVGLAFYAVTAAAEHVATRRAGA